MLNFYMGVSTNVFETHELRQIRKFVVTPHRYHKPPFRRVSLSETSLNPPTPATSHFNIPVGGQRSLSFRLT